MAFSHGTVWKLTGFISCSGQTKKSKKKKKKVVIDQTTAGKVEIGGGIERNYSAELPLPTQENFAAQT